MLDDYSEKDLKKDDIVEVLDTEKDDEWLVRKQAEKEKVSLLIIYNVQPIT